MCVVKIVAKIESYLAKIDFPGDLAQLPDDAYLVGGSVRDALLERYKTPVDLDFVLPQKSIATAKYFANTFGGGFVVLDDVREIARVVFEQGTLDLARQEGATLEIDLSRRDFTINAIAYSIKQQQLVDPLQGLPDLEQGILRMVSVKNLEDDPLRLLRAYRQAAQLDFTIEPETRTAIKQRVGRLTQVAAERVQAELNYLLTAPQGNKWLTAAIADGLGKFYLPDSDRVNSEQLEAIESAIQLCTVNGVGDRANFKSAELIILTKLSALVSVQPALAEVELSKLKYARSQIKAITKTVKYLPQLQQATEPMSLRSQYFWFLATIDVFPLLVVRAIALQVAPEIIDPLIERYLDPADLVAYPQCLVTGNDLMERLKLQPSRLIGELLTEIQIAQIESKINTFQQAIDFAAD
ncbi:MAG: CCA tRNA nucleotidyltransferase, partial [Cyanobacteria bacterium J06631_6]